MRYSSEKTIPKWKSQIASFFNYIKNYIRNCFKFSRLLISPFSFRRYFPLWSSQQSFLLFSRRLFFLTTILSIYSFVLVLQRKKKYLKRERKMIYAFQFRGIYEFFSSYCCSHVSCSSSLRRSFSGILKLFQLFILHFSIFVHFVLVWLSILKIFLVYLSCFVCSFQFK